MLREERDQDPLRQVERACGYFPLATIAAGCGVAGCHVSLRPALILVFARADLVGFYYPQLHGYGGGSGRGNAAPDSRGMKKFNHTLTI